MVCINMIGWPLKSCCGFSSALFVIWIFFQVKNFILLGDIHKSIYFLSWKEQGAQLNLLAKDFGSLDCLATEFLIDGSTLSLVVSDEQKNIQVGTTFTCNVSRLEYCEITIYIMGHEMRINC